MRIIDNEKDMPMFQEVDEDGYIEHIYCEGSRRHVLSWNSNGRLCSEPNCEVNKRTTKSYKKEFNEKCLFDDDSDLQEIYKETYETK